MRFILPALLAALLLGGCVSRGRDFAHYGSSGEIAPATVAELAATREAQAKYRALFLAATSVAEAKAAEEEIARLETRILELERRAAVEQRGRHEPRTILYGPVGFVLNLTERILEKLFILDVR